MLLLNLCKKALRTPHIVLAASAVLLFAPLALHATPVTYNLTLTETDGLGSTYSGTGSVTLDVPGGILNGVGYTPTSGVVALEFTIDGQTFSMADPTQQGNVTFGFNDFTTGNIWDVTFSETNANGYRIATNGPQYQYYVPPYNHPVSGGNWTGSFTASLSPPSGHGGPPVPEPSSIALLGTGLFAGAGNFFRRYRLKRS